MKNIKIDVEKLSIEFENEHYQLKTKSELFRKMYDLNFEIAEIAKKTNSHYSFVYGVIQNSREIRKTTKSSKSDEFRKLYESGKTVGEIAKTTNSNYSFVFSVIKKYKNQKSAK